MNLLSLFQETDFVCFDTGFNRFNNYDIDSLLASSPEANDSENERTPAQSQKVDETQPSADEEATDSETQTEHRDDFEDFVPENQSASTLESNSDVELESPSTLEPESADTPDASESPEEETEVEQTSSIESAFDSATSEGNETKDRREKSVRETLGEMNVSEIEPAVSEDESVIFENETSIPENKTDILENEPVSSSEHAQIPESETTLGTTFDAVATDDEITKSVTPYEEEESNNVRHPSENEIDDVVGTPLLPFSEETVTTPISDQHVKNESPQTTNDDKQESAEEKNMWTSIGDAVFSVVTGGERAESDASLEEYDEDEDEEEEKTSRILKSSYGANKEIDNPAPAELEEEPENAEPVLQDPLSSFVPHDDKEPDTDSDKLFFDSADYKEVTEHEEALEEAIKPTETSTILVDPISDIGSAAQQTDLRIAEEPVQQVEEKESIESEDDVDNTPMQDSSVAIDHREDLDSELAENKMVTDQDLASSGTHVEQSTEEAQLENLGIKEDEKIVEERIPDLVYDHSVTDLENDTSQPELSVEEPVTHVELPQDELEVDEDAQIEEEGKEELLEDENALSLTQSNDTDSEEPLPDTALPDESTPEMMYSDSVLRLTLLREHFTEEKMEQVQKLLGLKNLFKVEAMFSDLDTELQATRHSHMGGTQDIENALEGILETSENTILDEIEKMLDSQGTKHAYDQQTDAGGSDEETEILDDFQELAFSLRQKYSTASDSTPLTTEMTGISPGGFVMILLCASGLSSGVRISKVPVSYIIRSLQL